MRKLKFELGDLKSIAIVLAVVALVLAFSLQIMGDVQDDMLTGAGCNTTNVTGCGADYNATDDAIGGLTTISGKLGLIALVIVAVILIGLLVRYLGRM